MRCPNFGKKEGRVLKKSGRSAGRKGGDKNRLAKGGDERSQKGGTERVSCEEVEPHS